LQHLFCAQIIRINWLKNLVIFFCIFCN